MDRTQDGLSMIRQLPQEPNDVPRALTVETRGRFIQEQEQLWLAGELNTDRQPLPCFNSKAGDQSVSEWLEFEKFDDFFHVGVLLGYGNFAGLTQICRESHRFSNSRGTLMNVHLLSYFEQSFSLWRNNRRNERRTICSITSERRTKRLPIHEQVTSDHTNVLPLGEDIESSCFPGTARAHQRGQSPRLDVSINIVQQTTSATRYRNHVVDLLPCEGLTIRKRPLLRWDADIVDLLSGVLSFLERLVERLGLWVLPSEDRDVRSSV